MVNEGGLKPSNVRALSPASRSAWRGPSKIAFCLQYLLRDICLLARLIDLPVDLLAFRGPWRPPKCLLKDLR